MGIKKMVNSEAIEKIGDHESRAHAVFSPSSAKRWMNCPGCIEMSRNCPRPRMSVHAEEGTHAHEIAERILTDWLINDVDVLDAVEAHKKLFPNAEMEEHVIGYVLTIANLLARASVEKIAIEKRFKLPWEPESEGTADVCFSTKKKNTKKLTIVDFKYGQGVVVEVKDNPQLASYAVAADADPEWGPFDEIEVCVYQPRAEHNEGALRSMVLGRGDILEWRTELMTAVADARAELGQKDPILVPGDHCQFCPGEAICKPRMKYLQGDPELEFLPVPESDREPQTISEETIAKLILHRAEVEAFLKRVEEYAINCALANNPIPGLKLVHGRASRKWIDDEAYVGIRLKGMGIQDPYERKLIGITAAERLVGRNQLDGLTVKPEPSLKIVHESDPRPAVDVSSKAAENDFEVLEMTDGAGRKN